MVLLDFCIKLVFLESVKKNLAILWFISSTSLPPTLICTGLLYIADILFVRNIPACSTVLSYPKSHRYYSVWGFKVSYEIFMGILLSLCWIIWQSYWLLVILLALQKNDFKLGTDATHADHIETVKNRLYVALTGDGYLVPGELGMGLVEGEHAF